MTRVEWINTCANAARLTKYTAICIVIHSYCQWVFIFIVFNWIFRWIIFFLSHKKLILLRTLSAWWVGFLLKKCFNIKCWELFQQFNLLLIWHLRLFSWYVFHLIYWFDKQLELMTEITFFIVQYLQYKMNGTALCYFHGASACIDDFQVHFLFISMCFFVCVCNCVSLCVHVWK